MLLILLILIPLLAGLVVIFSPSKFSIGISTLASIATLIVSLVLFKMFGDNMSDAALTYNQTWIESIGATFSLSLYDGMSVLMVLLTAIAFPIIFVAFQNKLPERKNTFLGLMLFAEAGLMGVFLAHDALLFYLFWEVALIPVYFLSSMFGGEKRIAVTFKFFVYTFIGSLLMLVALLYIYSQTPAHSFSWSSFLSVGKGLDPMVQAWLFAALFIAFAIKMPIFPFHTWQPDAYEQSSTPVTIVMSALMVKMGLFAVVRWLLPVLPDACEQHMNIVITLSVIGVVYASLMAMVQSNIKRLIAYSSIAHVGLMCAAIFSHQILGTQGAVLQMFNHGINIMGLWIIVGILEQKLGTQDMNKMGGVAKLAPAFTIALVLISLANIALPLTNGFVGEFIMFNGLFNSPSKYATWFAIVAAFGIILSAVYTLKMIQKVAFGEVNEHTVSFKDLSKNEWIVLVLIEIVILVLGFYPDLIMNLVRVNS